MRTLDTTLPGLERIFSISHEILANPSLEVILHSIVQVAVELVACEKAAVLLADADAITLNLMAAADYQDRLFNIPVPVNGSIAGSAFSSSKPLIVEDFTRDPRYYPRADELLNCTSQSLLAIPLAFQARKIGVIEAAGKKQGPFAEADVDLLAVLAAQATITIEAARLYQQAQAEIVERTRVEAELRQNQEQLEKLLKERTAEVHRLEITDALTGLFNRSHLILLGNQAMQQAQRYHHSFAAMMIDIDHFRNINDTYSHAIGDEALKKLADILRKNLRSADISGRIGGQFIVLIPATNLQSAYQVAERLLDQIRVARVDTNQGQIGFTASIGVVEMDQTGLQTIHSLIDKAAQAMNTAKQAGRNQVFVGNEEPFIARLYRQAQEEIAMRIKVEEELRRHQDHLEELVKERTAEVHTLAITDSLTGLYNHGHLMLLGNQALQQAQRYHHAFSAMMIDLDHFKEVNDTYGHAIGDEVLRRLAGILRRSCRSADISGRYGGDEFVMLLPDTDLQSAFGLADQLLSQIRDVRIDTDQGQTGFIASIGVAEMDQDVPQSLDSLIVKADQAMYTAKQSGRNQVSTGEEEPLTF